MKEYNLNAGPPILPREVIENTVKQILDFNGNGLSLTGTSRRVKDFQPVVDEAVALIKELLQVSEGYVATFLGSGASLQFHMVPNNFFVKKATYLNTGTWVKKALREARFFGEVVEIASSVDKDYSYLPKGWSVPEDCDYFHITSNNTIYGTEIRRDLDVKMPFITDMSSGIFSRPTDVAKYACIYGGAQKNLAMAGVTFIIAKEGMLGKTGHEIPTMLDYRTHVEEGSMFNTPPVIPIYSALETLCWIKESDGVEAMDKLVHKRADLLYAETDRNKLFKGTVAEENRSLMNTCFVMNDEYKDSEKPFFELAIERDMVSIKGHRSIGGFRTSYYNAMSVDGVKELITCMKGFEDEH